MAWVDHTATLARVKPMDLIVSHAEEPEHRLKRSLGVVSLTAFGVAAIIGAGIFVLTGVAAATYAGPGITLSYVIAGIVSTLAALCYAELASTVPISGSAYTYSYAVLGERLPPRSVLGAILILGGILVAELKPFGLEQHPSS